MAIFLPTIWLFINMLMKYARFWIKMVKRIVPYLNPILFPIYTNMYIFYTITAQLFINLWTVSNSTALQVNQLTMHHLLHNTLNTWQAYSMQQYTLRNITLLDTGLLFTSHCKCWQFIYKCLETQMCTMQHNNTILLERHKVGFIAMKAISKVTKTQSMK